MSSIHDAILAMSSVFDAGLDVVQASTAHSFSIVAKIFISATHDCSDLLRKGIG